MGRYATGYFAGYQCSSDGACDWHGAWRPISYTAWSGGGGGDGGGVATFAKGHAEKLANVARLMGCKENLSDEALADWAIVAIEKLINSIGLKKNLTEYGVPEADYEKIAQEVRANFAMRLDMDPVSKQVPDLVWILKESAR